MSERYSRLFSLPENLYVEGAPVIIAAGTLLRDNQTGRIIAQVKFRSISDKIIKAVQVKLDLFDTAGNPIGDPVYYDYLDLNEYRDCEFGQKNPIYVSQTKARSYVASVIEVVCSNQYVWRNSISIWSPIGAPKLLNFQDDELLKQYKIRFGYNSIYHVRKERDLWFCTCGTLNHLEEKCRVCGNYFYALRDFDLNELIAEKNERLSKEAKDSQARKQKREMTEREIKRIFLKSIKIMVPTISVAFVLFLLFNYYETRNQNYKNAIALMESERYKEAITAFDNMDGYRDSLELIEECKNEILEKEKKAIEDAKAKAYAEAEVLLDIGEYTKAAIAFGELGDYRDSKERSIAVWKIAKRSWNNK